MGLAGGAAAGLALATSLGGRRVDALATTALGAGAKGDGKTDDRAALQAAIDKISAAGGGSLYVEPAPGGFYAINGNLYMRDNVEVYGAGAASASHIRNITTTFGPKAGVFHCGNYRSTLNAGGGTFQDESFYPCTPPAYAAQTITGLTPAQAGVFKVGSVAVLRSATQLNNSSHPVYERAELNEVTAVDAPNGRINLRYPVSESFVGLGAAVACSGAKGQLDEYGEPVKAVKNTTIRDIKLSNSVSRGWAIFPLGGCLNGRFLRIGVPESSAFMSMNGLARCTIDNTGVAASIRFERKLFDVAYFSHQTTVTNLVGDRIQGTVYEDTALSIGEGCHDITLKNVTARMGVTAEVLTVQKDAKRVCFVGTSRRVKLHDCAFAGVYVPRAVLEVYAGVVDELQRPEVLRCVLTGSARADYILGVRATSGVVSSNDPNGTGSVGQIVLEAGARSNTGSGNLGTVKDLSGNNTNNVS